MFDFQRAGIAAGLTGALALATGTDQAGHRIPGWSWSAWSEPVNLASVNSTFNEQNAVMSPDGKTLYFTSTRPGGQGNLDLWMAERPLAEGPWNPPVNLPPPLNTPGNDLAPHVSVDGRLLFFASDREGGYGAFDIYVARRFWTPRGFAWSVPENVGAPINTADVELAPFLFYGSLFNRGDQFHQAADLHHAVVDHRGLALGPIAPIVELNRIWSGEVT